MPHSNWCDNLRVHARDCVEFPTRCAWAFCLAHMSSGTSLPWNSSLLVREAQGSQLAVDGMTASVQLELTASAGFPASDQLESCVSSDSGPIHCLRLCLLLLLALPAWSLRPMISCGQGHPLEARGVLSICAALQGNCVGLVGLEG